MTKKVINVETGEEQIQELSKKDLEQQAIDSAAWLEKEKLAEQKLAAKSAIAERLGLTAEELATLLS